MEEKFIETYNVDDWEIETDTGWVSIDKIHKTKKYKVFVVKTNTFELKCADEHIVFGEDYEEIYVKNLKIGQKIWTKLGLERVESVIETDEEDNMYDIELKDDNHRYYTNGILSHNTTTTLIYLLWYAMKYPYKDILVTSFSEDSAKKNLNDIKTIYENCPMFIKRGVKAFNETSMVFDNRSRIYSRATTSKAARGLSPAIIYCDEFAFVGRGESPAKSLAMQEEFFAGISPALATSKGKLFITSTPIIETDLFYKLWQGAIETTDSQGLNLPKIYRVDVGNEEYNDLHCFKCSEEAERYIQENNIVGKVVEMNGSGRNGFLPVFSTWKDMPGRDEEWMKREIEQQGPSRFAREFNCLSGETLVSIMNEKGEIIDISLNSLFNYHL